MPISLSYRDPYFVLFGGFGVFEVFSYFRCKIWHHFLLGNPDFLQRRQNFTPISLRYQDLMRDRQTDRRGDRNRKLSHCKCPSLISVYNTITNINATWACPPIRASDRPRDLLTGCCENSIYALLHTTVVRIDAAFRVSGLFIKLWTIPMQDLPLLYCVSFTE